MFRNKISTQPLTLLAGVSAFLTVGHANIDVGIGGQGVGYYQTIDNSGKANLFDSGTNSRASLGLELKLDLALDHGFNIGYHEIFLGTLGLENSLIGAGMQTAKTDELNGRMTSQIFVTKELGKTAFKLGRQELEKNLSPFAFSESWNIFKNSFDALVIRNKDVESTTLLGAFIHKSNGELTGTPGLMNLGNFRGIGDETNNKGLYLLTAKNDALEKLPITLSYYKLLGQDLSVVWADGKFNYLEALKVEVQAGSMMDSATNADNTNAYGLKASGQVSNINLFTAYSHVNNGTRELRNLGTGIKTPLYTQLILNQNFISTSNDTVVFGSSLPIGTGVFAVKYNMTNDNSVNNIDYNELDVTYKFDAFNTKMLLAYVMQDPSNTKKNNLLRVWSRYNF